MREWFAKIRISAALDGGRRPAAWSRRETDLSDELRGFEQEMAALDRALKQTAPRPHAPPSLHGSIMRAVQAVERPAANARRGLALLRWLPVMRGKDPYESMVCKDENLCGLGWRLVAGSLVTAEDKRFG